MKEAEMFRFKVLLVAATAILLIIPMEGVASATNSGKFLRDSPIYENADTSSHIKDTGRAGEPVEIICHLKDPGGGPYGPVGFFEVIVRTSHGYVADGRASIKWKGTVPDCDSHFKRLNPRGQRDGGA